MKDNAESFLGKTYRQFYDVICGKSPNLYLWHFQWLDTFYLIRRLVAFLPTVSGNVLDVGCGAKPYQRFFTRATSYFGIDIAGGGGADLIVTPQDTWPLKSESFDTIFATQVVEHVENLNHTLGEISRVCKPGGKIILSFPFLYNEHGTPFDFQRFTLHGAKKLLPFRVEVLESQGGVGSTLVIIFLNWVNDSLNMNKVSRLIKVCILPFWIPFCLIANVAGLLVDRLDKTGKFYNNIFVVFVKN